MKVLRFILLLFFTFSITFAYAKSSKENKGKEEVILEDTFLVSMNNEMAKKVKSALKAQSGIKNITVDMQGQQVVVQYSASSNSTSNLLNMFKSIGCVAVAMETGCFGSKEGCLNARHPINWMP